MILDFCQRFLLIKHFPSQNRLVQSHLAEGFLRFLHPTVINEPVGGGIVAEGDHQTAQGADIDLHWAGEEHQCAADWYLILLGYQQFFIHIQRFGGRTD